MWAVWAGLQMWGQCRGLALGNMRGLSLGVGPDEAILPGTARRTATAPHRPQAHLPQHFGPFFPVLLSLPFPSPPLPISSPSLLSQHIMLADPSARPFASLFPIYPLPSPVLSPQLPSLASASSPALYP